MPHKFIKISKFLKACVFLTILSISCSAVSTEKSEIHKRIYVADSHYTSSEQGGHAGGKVQLKFEKDEIKDTTRRKTNIVRVQVKNNNDSAKVTGESMESKAQGGDSVPMPLKKETQEKRMPLWQLFLGFLPVFTLPLISWWTLAGVSLYTLVLFFKKPLRKLYDSIKINEGIKFLITETFFSLLVEVLAIIDNLPLPPSDRILLNPYPLPDLYLATGFYLAFALWWKFLLDRYDYDAKEVFILGGIFGILIEQVGAIFLSFNPFLWLYVFLVYGSIEAMGVVVAENHFKKRQRKHLPFWKKFFLTGIFQLFSWITAGIFIAVLSKIAGL